MNAAVKPHLMQAVNWKKFTLEEWLYQVGAWLDQDRLQGHSGGSLHPIAVAMWLAAKKEKAVKLPDLKRDELVANYIADFDSYRVSRAKIACLITGEEAHAVQTLIVDMMGQSDALDTWLIAVKKRYFRGFSFSDMVSKDCTLMDVKFDVKCGLAALHARYPHILKLVKSA